MEFQSITITMTFQFFKSITITFQFAPIYYFSITSFTSLVTTAVLILRVKIQEKTTVEKKPGLFCKIWKKA